MKNLITVLMVFFSPSLMARSLTDPYVLSVLIPFFIAIVLFGIGLVQYFKQKPFKNWFIGCFFVMVLQQALLFF